MRPEGYYWVRIHVEQVERVLIAEWSDGAWWRAGWETPIESAIEVEVLSERLEPPLLRAELSPGEVLAAKKRTWSGSTEGN
jgi:hypothetical protein